VDGLALNEDGGYGRRMSDNNPSQIHVTAWPGVPLLLPTVYRAESKLTDDGVIVPCPRGVYGEDWELEPVEPDGETYLRLGATDLENPKAIFAFVEKYGVLGGWDLYITFEREAPFAAKELYGSQLDTTSEVEKRRRALPEESGAIWGSEALPLHYSETLDEFRFAARCLRDLTSAWRMFQDGTPAGDVEWVSPQQPGSERDTRFLQEDSFPLFLLREALPSWFLRPFTPRLTFDWPRLRTGDMPAFQNLAPRNGGIRVDQPMRQPVAGRLYNICALELYNHIVENAEYLICGNDNCEQKNFVHQQGREKNWYRSSGVLYCSYGCAHAVAQRKYRRKKSNEKRGRPA
jgi:hypothetical protein